MKLTKKPWFRIMFTALVIAGVLSFGLQTSLVNANQDGRTRKVKGDLRFSSIRLDQIALRGLALA